MVAAFDPRAGGPLSAQMQWEVGTRRIAVPLSGIGAIGTTQLHIESPAGDGLPTGRFLFTLRNSYLSVGGISAEAQPAKSTTDDLWAIDAAEGTDQHLQVGRYSDAVRNPSEGQNLLDISGGSYGCNTNKGEFDVAQAVYGSDDQVIDHLRATYTQRCTGSNGSVSTPVTAQLDYDYAPHLTPPRQPTHLLVMQRGGHTVVTWSRTAERDVAYSVVRLARGRAADVAPNSGDSLYMGAGRTTTTTSLAAGRSYTIEVFDVDKYGNVSRGTSTSFSRS